MTEFGVQSLFELTNSKPTRLALKAVPSEQLFFVFVVHTLSTMAGAMQFSRG